MRISIGLLPRLLAAAGLSLTLGAAPPPASSDLVVGRPAPDFEIRLMDGRKTHLSELKGKVVILNLWANWCMPCKTEMPELDTLQVNGEKFGLQIYGLLVLDNTHPSKFRRLREALHYPLAASISNSDYHPIEGAVPTNYIFDRKGVLRYAKASAMTRESIAELVVPLLREAP